MALLFYCLHFRQFQQRCNYHDPGKVFNYNSSTSHLLSAILTTSTKTSNYNQARHNKNGMNMSALISDRFPYNGVTKQSLRIV